eukprot:gene2947-5792_t
MVKGFGTQSSQISHEIILHCIFPYLNMKQKFSFAAVCKDFRGIALSEESTEYWNQCPFEFCIDSYCCPLCPLKTASGRTTGALSILSNIPFRRIKMHGFITNIPDCLLALSHKGKVQSLHLTVTNKANSPPLSELLPDTLTVDMFPNLTEFTLDSTHLQYVNPAGRSRLLRILGSRLESLSFVGLSPSKMFLMLNETCPYLLKLRVDKAHSIEDLATYRNDNLMELELCRTNFLLNVQLLLPNLTKLRFTPSCRYDILQFEHMISCLPRTLTNLSLEVPSDIASEILSAIGNFLPNLVHLRLEGSFLCGVLQQSGLLALCRGCSHLEFFEVHSSKSVTTLGFDKDSFQLMGLFPSLRSVRVMYEECVVTELITALQTSHTLREIILWERMRWSSRPWTQMRLRLQEIATCFPNTEVVLEDASP